jgi:hypothetical protein
MRRYEYKVVDTGKHIEDQLNALGEQGWRVVGVTTKKQLFIAPPRRSSSCVRSIQPADRANYFARSQGSGPKTGPLPSIRWAS